MLKYLTLIFRVSLIALIPFSAFAQRCQFAKAVERQKEEARATVRRYISETPPADPSLSALDRNAAVLLVERVPLKELDSWFRVEAQRRNQDLQVRGEDNDGTGLENWEVLSTLFKEPEKSWDARKVKEGRLIPVAYLLYRAGLISEEECTEVLRVNLPSASKQYLVANAFLKDPEFYAYLKSKSELFVCYGWARLDQVQDLEKALQMLENPKHTIPYLLEKAKRILHSCEYDANEVSTFLNNQGGNYGETWRYFQSLGFRFDDLYKIIKEYAKFKKFLGRLNARVAAENIKIHHSQQPLLVERPLLLEAKLRTFEKALQGEHPLMTKTIFDHFVAQREWDERRAQWIQKRAKSRLAAIQRLGLPVLQESQ